MRNVAAFHTWLLRQTPREDEVGSFSQLAESTPDWPAELESKEELRAWLRGHGLKTHIAALAMAWEEFVEIARPWWWGRLDGDECEGVLGTMAEPLVRPWWDAGHPSMEEIETRAEAGEPAALAFHALRVCAGVSVPLNPLVAIEHWERAFEAGFVPAAAALYYYHRAVRDLPAASAWLTRGLRAGHRGLLDQAWISQKVAEREGTLKAHPEMDAAELEALWQAAYGETGEREFLEGRALSVIPGFAEPGCQLLQVAAEKGWGPAFESLANQLSADGRTPEALAWIHRGAAAGDADCLAWEAVVRLRDRSDEAEAAPTPEGAADVALMEARARRGDFSFLVFLARYYMRGEHVPADPEKAELYASAYLFSSTDADMRVERATMLHQVLEGKFPRPRVQAARRWLVAMGAQAADAPARHLAGRLWASEKAGFGQDDEG